MGLRSVGASLPPSALASYLISEVIERILRHLGSGKSRCACIAAPTRRAKRPSIGGSTTPSPTTTPNRVIQLDTVKRLFTWVVKTFNVPRQLGTGLVETATFKQDDPGKAPSQ